MHKLSTIGTTVAPLTNNNSKIGIGTTNPQATLHVNGSLVVENALTLYLLSTPQANEWQYVGSVGPQLQLSYNFNTPTPLKAILADVYLGGSSFSDHQNFRLGRNHLAGRDWTDTRNTQPGPYFTNAAGQFIRLTLNGEVKLMVFLKTTVNGIVPK